MSTVHSSFADLTWDDLEAWAGAKIVSRGRSYKKHVLDMRLMDDGGLIAWVPGTETYATRVLFDQTESLVAECSCPYDWGPCKHSVAVILAYLDVLKKKGQLAPADPQDKRLKLLDAVDVEKMENEGIGEEGEWDDEWEKLGSQAGLSESDARSSGRKRSKETQGKDRDRLLQEHFQAMSKDELVAFALDHASRYPEFGDAIMDQKNLKSGKVDKIVKSLRSEIRELTREQAWVNSWTGEGNRPDYAHVHRQLAALLETGHADEVVALGADLWEWGNEQIGRSDDEGDTAGEISECMDIVFSAVRQSSLPPANQLLRIVEACLGDDYSALDERWYDPPGERYGREEWSSVADKLAQRLAAMPKPKRGDPHHSRYERGHLMRWVIGALDRAKRKTETIPLLEREASITACYVQLVDRLTAARRKKEARKWAIDGFRATTAELPGIADELAAKLRDMAKREKNHPLVAAYRALEFFDNPSLPTYLELQKAAGQADCWEAVGKAALEFLETGRRPDVPATAKSKRKNVPSSSDWPLPPTELSDHTRTARRPTAPDAEALIDIALHEQRHDDAIRWLDISRKDRRWHTGRELAVAEAVQSSHPDAALTIWADKAEELINRVKPAAYEEAARYMRHMHKVYKRTDRIDQWEDYLKSVRGRHKPKRKLMEVLDKLEGKRANKRIIDS